MILSVVSVVIVLTCSVSLHSEDDLKVALMNVQHSLIWELKLYQFKVGHNVTEATKSICCVKGAVTQYSNQMVQEILLRLQEH